MSMPTISDINPEINIEREDAINMIIASIAMEELALAHILNAEGEKLQYVLGTLKDRTPGEITLCDIMAVNTSIQKTLGDVIKAEMLLQFKLEDAIELGEGNKDCQITITGRKIWRDGDNIAKTRPPSVKINLLRDGVFYRSDDVASTGDGRYTFYCLPIYKSPGVKYTYTVDEPDVPVGYTKTVDGYNVINTVKPGTTTIDATKTWVDDNGAAGKRPTEITINLLQNNVLFDSEKIASPPVGENTSNFSFENVDQFDEEGSPFVYTIDEDPIEGYEKNITGYHITNTLK